MAEQAQQEPTMEEILSSIRKIIADDEQPSTATNAAVSPDVVEVKEADDDSFEDLDLSFDEGADSLPQTEDEVLAAISQIEDDNDVFETIDATDDFIEEPGLDDSEDEFEALPELESKEAVAETLADPEPLPEFEPPAAEPVVEEEPVAVAAPQTEEVTMSKPEPIVEAKTMDAAAGSLGKLLSKVEFGEDGGGNNTIEGVVREMLRPMLKEWLDENLPGIVEKHVEAEVQRIASMAR